MFCREHVVQLHRTIDDIHAAGAELYVIGNGTPNFIAGFRETTGYDGPLYVDPSLEAYRVAGLKRGVLSTFGPRSALRGIRTLTRGHKQGRTQGDPWQQGGTLVVDPGGQVIMAHVSSGAGDNAAPEQILSALG